MLQAVAQGDAEGLVEETEVGVEPAKASAVLKSYREVVALIG